MAATPALAGPNRVCRAQFRSGPPILICVPDISAVAVSRPPRGRLARRRLRRDRVLLVLIPLVALAGLVAWDASRPRVPRSSSTPSIPPPAIRAIVAEPLPLAEPLVVADPTHPGPSPALAVRPAGYLIPDEEPASTEGYPHAEPRR